MHLAGREAPPLAIESSHEAGMQTIRQHMQSDATLIRYITYPKLLHVVPSILGGYFHSQIRIEELGRSGLSTWKYQFSYDH